MLNTSKNTAAFKAFPTLIPQKNDTLMASLLSAMEIRVDELKTDITTSQDLLPLGVHTDLTTLINNLISNPISLLIATREDLNKTIKSFVRLVLKAFFTDNESIIKKVIESEVCPNELHFSIFLYDDNEENRLKILSFLREYKATDLYNQSPIYFQFVPSEFEDKIFSKEILINSDGSTHRAGQA